MELPTLSPAGAAMLRALAQHRPGMLGAPGTPVEEGEGTWLDSLVRELADPEYTDLPDRVDDVEWITHELIGEGVLEVSYPYDVMEPWVRFTAVGASMAAEVTTRG